MALLATVYLGASLAALVPGSGIAQDEGDGYLIIKSAYAEINSGVYYLNSLIEIRPSHKTVEALAKGVSLTYELQIEVERKRRFWFNKIDASLKQRYELRYHALSQRYIVVNENSGEKTSLATLDSALNRLGNVSTLPVLDEALIETDSEYEIRVRAVLENKSVPGPLRPFYNWFTDWRMTSEWFRWQLFP